VHRCAREISADDLDTALLEQSQNFSIRTCVSDQRVHIGNRAQPNHGTPAKLTTVHSEYGAFRLRHGRNRDDALGMIVIANVAVSIDPAHGYDGAVKFEPANKVGRVFLEYAAVNRAHEPAWHRKRKIGVFAQYRRDPQTIGHHPQMAATG